MNTYALTNHNTTFRVIIKAPNMRTILKAINLGVCLPEILNGSTNFKILPTSNQQESTRHVADDELLEKLKEYSNTTRWFREKNHLSRPSFTH